MISKNKIFGPENINDPDHEEGNEGKSDQRGDKSHPGASSKCLINNNNDNNTSDNNNNIRCDVLQGKFEQGNIEERLKRRLRESQRIKPNIFYDKNSICVTL